MCMSDITYYNLIALIETEGYGVADYMYYVKDEGLSVASLGNIEDGDKMDDMLDKFEKSKILNLTVIKGNATTQPI